ncbi:MAG TPA: sigma-70 family RNA polymerase sigma factor [Polyangiaceae bacterium]|jgi:RNA polymerase sigma-70 factor (ECF subfamily)|nr:sigma-70 family RNA polymerase sigma factor [Polyangiaceae bacterium]
MLPKPHLRLVAPALGVARGVPVTFEALFGNYSGYVARVAARLLGSGDAELDDVVQDVFWLASRRIAKIPDLVQARGWLATVTTRVVRRKLQRRRFRALFHAAPGSAEIPARGATAEEHALLARLYEVLDRLPTEQRLAWALRFLEGEPLDAVAAACGCSLSTAKRRVAAAKSVIDEVFRDD